MRKFLKGITFVAILIALLVFTSYVFSPKNNDRKSGMLESTAYAIMAEEKDTIDTLIIGDSESYSSFSPMQIWDEHGYTSYVCGTPGQQLYQSYDFLVKTLKTQKPKVVILEANCIYRKLTINQYVQFQIEQWIPLLKYHDRWKKLQPQDFYQPIDYTWQHDTKGYRYFKGIKSSKIRDYMKNRKKTKRIEKNNLYFLNKIRTLCDEENIKFVLINAPNLKNWNYEKHMGVQEYADKHGIDYVDMNLKNKEVGIDWLKDTRDQGDHLNFTGARKATRYLGQYLKEQNILMSHKNDKKYESWNECLKKYKKTIQEKVNK